jgi:hypothetical protein
MNDRVSDLARADVPDCDRGVGRSVMSLVVVRFIPRPRDSGERTDFPTIAFRFEAETGEYADTAPCEYVAQERDGT